MIQRVQTLYLVLAFICSILLLFFPVFSVSVGNGTETIIANFGAYGITGENVNGGFPLYLIFISSALLTFAAILLFKRRPRQLLVCRLNLILHGLLTMGIYVFYYFGGSAVAGALKVSGREPEVTFNMDVGFFLLIPPLAFIYLAIRGIKRDENLIRSLDRLR